MTRTPETNSTAALGPLFGDIKAVAANFHSAGVTGNGMVRERTTPKFDQSIVAAELRNHQLAAAEALAGDFAFKGQTAHIAAVDKGLIGLFTSAMPAKSKSGNAIG